MEIKSKRAILTQKPIAKMLGCCDSTITRHGSDIKMTSPFRSSENQKGLKRPQKTSKESSSLIEFAKPISYKKITLKGSHWK